jgi:hypothetical protein
MFGTAIVISHDHIFGMELGEFTLWLGVISMLATVLKQGAKAAKKTSDWHDHVDVSLGQIQEVLHPRGKAPLAQTVADLIVTQEACHQELTKIKNAIVVTNKRIDRSLEIMAGAPVRQEDRGFSRHSDFPDEPGTKDLVEILAEDEE